MEIIDYLLARKKAGGGSDVTIEQLTATENGTYSEEGIAYSPVVVNVPAPANSYQLKDLPSGTVSTIDDGTALPAPSLKIGIEPAQDLHGYDHPWVGGAGKNKINIPDIVVSSDGYLFNGDISLPAGKYVFSILKNDGVTSSSHISIAVVMSDGNTATSSPTTSGNRLIRYIDASETIVSMRVYAQTGTYSEAQLEEGSTATSYEPYSNICPISGWTAADIVVSPTTDAEDGTTYTIEFRDGDNPLTVYGGTLDVTSGVLTVTDAYIASYNAETLPSTWISDRDVYAEGTSPTTGAEVVYKLANSVTYSLDPTQVRTLVGNNNIWADTGNIIEGKYFKSLV